MRGLAGWTLVALLLASAAWAKKDAPAKPKPAAPKPAAAVSPGLSDLERDMALGSELAQRPGTEAQFADLQKLTDRGVKSAQEAVAKNPKSADAQYSLGSWLLYSYRVVKADRITYDEQGVEHQDKVLTAIQGNPETTDEGLEALRKACDLAPTSGRYLVDYGAALVDYDHAAQASAVLKKAWMGDVQLTTAQKLRAAVLMSDIDTDQGDLASARGWLYRALAENRENSEIVARLRQLDALQAEAAALPPAGEESGEEVAPEEGDGSTAPDQTEVAPEEDQSEGGSVDGGAEQPETGGSDEAPAAPETDSSD